MSTSANGDELGAQVLNLLQAKDQPLGSILRALAAQGVSRAVASNTIDTLIHQGRIVVTDQRRVQLVRNQPAEAAG
ncbi:hypothetical protein [Mycobacterium sp. 1245111.1]|uniref:hypothetical protein n=1 Tax=Mycobacterium sp. 1245111.1 TaxID=1834073 RepID=UPI000A9F60B2|nr:hypothetical protein [Mycobacterium sp. 1245111.1]